MDADTLQETYNIPTTHNILPQQTNWLLHQRELSSLSDTSTLTVTRIVSQDAGAYVQQHDLSQNNNYLDYSNAKNQGFIAGPDTEVT